MIKVQGFWVQRFKGYDLKSTERAAGGLLFSVLYETSLKNFVGFAKNPEFVMPVPDQVQDDGSGIQNFMKLLDSGLRRNDAPKKF